MDASAGSVGEALRVLVVGGGGRDHALCSALASSPRCTQLHAVPGNAGIERIATCHPDVDPADSDAVLELVGALRPDLVVIGAEDLLVGGLASRIAAIGITCLGPSREAAQLEGSKRFAKQLMEQAGVPTPSWRACEDIESAYAAIDALGGAVAVKADGLAAGCGAFVCWSADEAREVARALLVERRLGASGASIIIEELVEGVEASVMAVVDGSHVVALPAARDYKRLGDGDAGPNTGGMGAHAPSVDLAPAEAAALAHDVIQPIVDELARRGTPFRGVVYAGVMLTAAGPLVLEYNCRLGNPETQALVRILDADLLDLLDRAARGALAGTEDVAARGAAVAVCIATASYPEQQLEPAPVTVRGLESARAVPGIELYLGLCQRGAGPDEVSALGGRAVTVSAWGVDHAEAVARAYAAADRIVVDGAQLRRDIGAGVPDVVLA